MPIRQNILIAVDAVVFGYMNADLNVLLVKRKGSTFHKEWALVGGFVLDDEPLTTAVKRELKEETGVQLDYLEQLYTFGDTVDRDPRSRVISVAYFGLIDSSKIVPIGDTDAMDAKWYPINELPALAFDHSEILNTALNRLRAKLTYQPIGFDLLPNEFLFSELEQLYVTILGKEIDRRNFRKKIMSFGFLEETSLFKQKKSGRPAKLFRFNNMKYRELESKGIFFDL
jgi:8-oxo-dGTP diphosphatase